MNLPNTSPTPQRELWPQMPKTPLTLEIHGPIPSFKNNKLMIPPSLKALGRALLWGNLKEALKEFNTLKKKRTLLITKPEYQEAMEKMISDIESQLRSASLTAVGPTCPESLIRSWIALSMPADDCWTKIPEIIIRAELVEEGQEGATITIQRL